MAEPQESLPADDPSRASAQQRRILDAAAGLFRDQGYAATSMRDLARAVDLQVSSLYNHIRSKQDLLRRICFEHGRRFLTAMDSVEKKPRLSADEKIMELLRLHMDMALRESTSITAFNDEWRHLEEPDLSRFVAMRRAYEDRFLALLRQGMAEGNIRKMNERVLLYTLLSSVRWLYDGYRPERFPAPEEVLKEMRRLLLNGMAN